jgi:DNA-directed RNA polymerase subunit L
MAETGNISDEVRQALTQNQDQIQLETIQDEDSSPLNRPVIEKDIGGEKKVLDNDNPDWNVWKPEMDNTSIDNEEKTTTYRESIEDQIEYEKQAEPLDAPEQEINLDGQYDDNGETITNKDFEIPLAQANQAATALLGMTNNLLAAGGGLLVKIKKQPEFYEYGEVVTVIDEQNQKNVNRILLDKEDKTLLRPLVAEVLRKKAKKLTPEQQLMGAVASILMKKAQVVMEIRGENALLENRIVAIIKEQEAETEDTFAEADNETEVYNEVEEEKPTSDSAIVENPIIEFSEDQPQKNS